MKNLISKAKHFLTKTKLGTAIVAIFAVVDALGCLRTAGKAWA